MFNTKQYKASFFEVLKLVIVTKPSITNISATWRMLARQVKNIKITSFLNSFVNSKNNTPGSIIMSLEDYRICIANNVFLTGTSIFRTSYIDSNLDPVSINIPVVYSVALRSTEIHWLFDQSHSIFSPLRGHT